jgi:hypothetical protein
LYDSAARFGETKVFKAWTWPVYNLIYFQFT